jgi:hypothetical protein
MKAVFTLTPAESRRLIAKAVVQMEEVKIARERAYIILAGGTTNGFIAQELLGEKVEPQRFTAGTNCSGFLCATNASDRNPFPIILERGRVSKKDIRAALEDFSIHTVFIKGANAIDPLGNVGIITSGWDGGTVGNSLGILTSTGLRYLVPVGLEKLIPSVPEAVAAVGSKTFDYSLGANFGMFILCNANVVTEIRALKILANVSTKLVAAGGIGGSEGSVVLVAEGAEPDVKRVISLIEPIKGEKPVPPLKGLCATCPYSCKFKGMKEEDLPSWVAPHPSRAGLA